MRKIHTVTLGNIDNGERVKAIDIISKALAKDFGKECIVVQEGHMSDCALEAIPSSVCVFVVSSEHGKDFEPVPDVPAAPQVINITNVSPNPIIPVMGVHRKGDE
jgi:hypothetical protein